MIHKITTKSPKKPNSGVRKVAKIKIHYHLRHTRLTARLTGSYNRPVKFNRVLIRGGRANDLPGISYTVIRGAMDCLGLTSKHRRRSIYGVKIPKSLHTHIRRKLRKTFTKLKTTESVSG